MMMTINTEKKQFIYNSKREFLKAKKHWHIYGASRLRVERKTNTHIKRGNEKEKEWEGMVHINELEIWNADIAYT